MDERERKRQKLRENAMLSRSPEEDKLFAAHPSTASYHILSLSFTLFFSASISRLPVFVVRLEVARL